MASHKHIYIYVCVCVVNYIPIIKLATYHNPIDDSVICFLYIGNVIIPTDDLHHFSEGLAATTNQPRKTMKSQVYTIFLWTAGGHHGLGIISPFISPFQWIGFRENLQETIVFPIKYGAFLQNFP